MPNDLEIRILTQANELFMRYGVRSITMDDIASGLGISKKTIYQSFENKAEIVNRIARDFFEQDEREIESITQNSVNAIDELVQVISRMVRTFRDFNPTMVHDIRRYYPEAWKLFENHKSTCMARKVRENLARGIREGLYRQRIDIEIVARSRVIMVELGLMEEYFPSNRFDYREVQVQLFEMYLYGLVTDKGRALLESYMKTIDLNLITLKEETPR